MMDVFERYFHYDIRYVCGIPSVTLEGDPADWDRLKEKTTGLRVFEIDWWLDHLDPVCDQFARASRGDIDISHWQRICKLREAYGGDRINGWVAKLFPYLRSWPYDGPCTRISPIFQTSEDGFGTSMVSSGLSRVPFTQTGGAGQFRKLEAIGGLIGMTQDAETLALRPKVGWAVRSASRLETLFTRLDRDHRVFPGRRADAEQLREDRHLPSDLAAFYHHSNGADILGPDGADVVRISSESEVEPIDWGEIPEEGINTRGPDGRIWHRLVTLTDGSWLAINLDSNIRAAAWRQDTRLKKLGDQLGRTQFAPICHTSAKTVGLPGRNPVVALSFTELLERLLDSGGESYWLAPDFEGYGDAELYTRRE